jgi:predicted MFS family arabinose efflux permease
MKNLGDMMKQVQAMQSRMAEMQAKLENATVTGQSGGGLVKAISALVVAYAVGTTAGPLLGGAVFTAGGLHGLAGLLLGLSLAGLAWCLWSARQPNRPGARTGSPPSL